MAAWAASAQMTATSSSLIGSSGGIAWVLVLLIEAMAD